MDADTLVVIPARGGSKGIPHKNINIFNGKPLITYAIDCARAITLDNNICVSTDDDEIIEVVENYGLKVPFKRPDYLATDQCSTYDVLLHALDFYESINRKYKKLILLQPTSPFRTKGDVEKADALYSDDIDMVVSVTDASGNYYKEDQEGLLKNILGETAYTRRQDMSKMWRYNGAVYVINVLSLRQMPLSKFQRIRKYEMDEIHSIDLDTMFDWKLAEFVINEKLI
jgi:N-acylneuraminate cytidylyltransferase